MIKAKRFLTLDVEATGLGKNARIFDLGYTIATRKSVLLERQFLIREVLCNGRTMLGALQNEDWRNMMGYKLFETYIPEIEGGTFKTSAWCNAIETLQDDILTYDVDVFTAYNLAYDRGALANTQKFVTGKSNKILPRPVDLLDLWYFSCVTVCNTRGYHNAADQFGWRSDAGNVRTNAEKTYAYLTGQFNFVESHTALHDAQIETEILQRLLDKRKRIPYNSIMASPWRLAQTTN